MAWLKSWVYSRILLYLVNLITCFTFYYKLDDNSFPKEAFKQGVSLIKKTYNYVKEVIKFLNLKFDPEEVDAFHRLRKEFIFYIREKVAKVAEERLKQNKERSENTIQKNQESIQREKSISKKRIQDLTNIEQYPKKKVKSSEMNILEGKKVMKTKKRRNSLEDSCESSGDEEYVIKKKTKKDFGVNLAKIKKKKLKKTNFKEEEMKSKILIEKSLEECLSKVTNHYRS